MKYIYIYSNTEEISIDKRMNSFKRFTLPYTINHRCRFIILSALAIKTNRQIPLISRRFNNPALIVAGCSTEDGQAVVPLKYRCGQETTKYRE